jgi:hypothetical protein
MIPPEIDIHGVYVPGFLALMFAAYLTSRLIRGLFRRAGFYALVWPRALFDIALYVVILGAFFVVNIGLTE